MLSFIRQHHADHRLRRRAARPVNPENLEFSFPFLMNDARAVRKRYAERFDAAKAVAQAEAILAQPIPGAEDWRHPPGESPRTPSSAGRAGAPGETRLRLSRQELAVLGKAYFLTGEERFADNQLARFLSWREAHPPFRGPEWSDPCEAACRVMNWIWAFSFLRGARAFDRAAQREVLETVYRHGEYMGTTLDLEAHPARRIGAAAGLAVAGAHFCLADRAEEWSDRGFAAMTDGALRWLPQFRAAHDRPAMRLALEIIIPAYVIAKSKRVPLRVSFLREIEECARHLLAGEEAPPAPDAESSISPAPRLEFAAAPDARRHIGNALAIISRNAELKSQCAPLDEQTFWIFGLSGADAYEGIE